MKLLAISTWFPYPPDNGSKIRAYNLLSRLGAEHEIDLIAMSQSERDANYLDNVKQFCRTVRIFPEPQFDPNSTNSWLGFFSPVPRYFRAHQCQDMETLALRWSEEESYDAVVAVTLGAAPYAVKLNVPLKVLDQHNVESRVIKRQCLNGGSVVRKLRYTPTWIKAEKFERMLAREFGAITVVSEDERRFMEQVLQNGHSSRVHVVPNGVDPSLLDYDGGNKESGVLAFTGGLAYQPNYDAAMRLCKRILPAVQSKFPFARARITGSLDRVDIRWLQDTPGVEFTGYVEDIRPVVASASMLVVPLWYGGGTRLKILEAMALGTPVVSTPTGAEGLEVIDGKHILLGDTEADLSRQVSRLLADTYLAERIAENAREMVRDRYQWSTIADGFERILSDMK